MRKDSVRIMKLLDRFWQKHPEMRFGQLLIASGLVEDNAELWLKEDSDVKHKLERMCRSGLCVETPKTSVKKRIGRMLNVEKN